MSKLTGNNESRMKTIHARPDRKRSGFDIERALLKVYIRPPLAEAERKKRRKVSANKINVFLKFKKSSMPRIKIITVFSSGSRWWLQRVGGRLLCLRRVCVKLHHHQLPLRATRTTVGSCATDSLLQLSAFSRRFVPGLERSQLMSWERPQTRRCDWCLVFGISWYAPWN